MTLTKRCIAEFIGTFWLVFGGCGSAVFAATFTGADLGNNVPFPLGIGFAGVSLAFGLTMLTMAYAIGHISGCHLNPAVSFGLWAGKRFPGSELLPYIVAQVLGASVAGGLIYLIASGAPNFALTGSNPLATNGFGEHSPGGYSLLSCLLIEVLLTFIFLMVILGVTDERAPQGFAPIAIGLCLTLIHLISIPVTNTSVNPARSTGVALFAGAELFSQVWLFWLAPIVGAILAGRVHNALFSTPGLEEASRLREPV
ncbi:aquaporin Z [Leptolyngbya sp. FACHB-711]|uniref:aquaporin Z n=1 Tax=unclassified Leptolyngbya TaxID=2650499 RepID=UPI001683C1D4|nr:aquaporin Z [Leptolyngbya sp. FACHB-711]MBD1852208.1 aquaporin Z [Cyanobacteria bacterium FACHB-502]MBD2027369.1 aquaporin Z [Leptolyngbya sp. FACHB-711]